MTDNNHWLSQIKLGEWYSNAQYYYRPRNDRERNLMHSCYEAGYNTGYAELLDKLKKEHIERKEPDEAKAEEYLEPIHRMYSCNNEHYTDEVILQAYLDGLAEGRREEDEKYEMALLQIKNDREKVIEYNERLQKENKELRAQLEDYKMPELRPDLKSKIRKLMRSKQ